MSQQPRPDTDTEAEHPQYAGHYRLETRLGSGGMGVVHLARSTSGLRLAVKVVHTELAQDSEFRGRFRQEVGAARRVSGAFTAPVVDADPEAERPWMATLFIPGPTLAEYVKEDGPLPPAHLRHLMAGLAEALRDIHRAGVVHRDLKPSNVLLADDGPKVIDFGISRPSDSELRTETGKLIGTPPFMAPEQFRTPRDVGPAADVFALGSVIVHAATGRGPFDSDSPYIVAYQVVHDEPDLTGLPEELTPVVSRCLAKEPEDRPTAEELMVALRAVSASHDTQSFSADQWHSGEWRLARTAGKADGVEDGGSEPRDASAYGDEEASQRAPGKATGDTIEGRLPARRRFPRMSTAAVVATTLLAVGAVLALALYGSSGGGRAHPAGESSDKQQTGYFAPWETHLKNAGSARAKGMPECTYGLGELYCAQPGVMAAAVDPADGKVLWSRNGTSESDDAAPAWPPVLAGGLLHVAFDDGKKLAALEPSTGRTRWTLDIARYSGRIAHVGDQVLLTAPDSKVTAVDGATGHELWSHPIAGQTQPIFSSYGGGTAYAVSLTPDGKGTVVSGVNPRTGDVRWRQRFNGSLTPLGEGKGVVWLLSYNTYTAADAVVRYEVASHTVRRVPLVFPLQGAQATVHGDTVYVLADGGSLVAMNTKGDRAGQLWRLETSVSRTSPPVAVDRRLYFTAADGRLYAVDTARGALLGQTEPRIGGDRGALLGSLPGPVVADTHVYSAAPDGSLFAVEGQHPSRW
ncbi:serine/threonine-protein kinase [Streptomyces sp. NPDC002577]